MDVIPLPERKKPGFVKATQEQIDILQSGYAASETLSKERAAKLSEATGLTLKWISSWFQRERRKKGHARLKPRKHTTKTAMSVQEIAAFKTEHSDFALSETVVSTSDRDPDEKPPLSKDLTKKTRKPRKKRKPPTPPPDRSPLKAPFVSLPLPPRLPRPHPQASIQAQPQTADPDSPTSRFILREMVPLIYKPRSQSPSHPIPHDTEIDPLSVPPHFSLTRPASPSTSALSGPRILSPNFEPDTSYRLGNASHLGSTFLWQESAHTQSPSAHDSHHKTYEKVGPTRATRELPKDSDLLKRPSSQRSLGGPGPIRPLLPLNPPTWNTAQFSLPYQHRYPGAAYGAYSQGLSDNSMKENQPMYYHPTYVPQAPSKLRSHGSRILPPLFATSDLTRSGSRRQVLSATATQSPASSIPTPPPPPSSSFQPAQLAPQISHTSLPSQSQEVVQPHDQYSFFFDSTTAPLKHLDVLAPSPDYNENFSIDEMINLLLDERLATEDPFQAAMGLVFASQLGLSWDIT
ncbi:hypothetical protein C0991_012410 [Blastosporella zonata]|nr:hypothetical protein C0991_012410 [Blastosporella zonata]